MSRTIDRALALARSAQGTTAPHLEAFAASLIAQQYSTFCVHHKVCVASLARRRLDPRVDLFDHAKLACIRAASNCNSVSFACADAP